jgi:hypothetical protein
MSSEITRVTMIKIPSEAHQVIALQGFETFTVNQKRVFYQQELPDSNANLSLQDGKPYILSMQAGRAQGYARDQGYTIVAKSVFKNADDMEFYEKECPGHEEYKMFLKKNAPVEGLMAVAFQASVSFNI